MSQTNASNVLPFGGPVPAHIAAARANGTAANLNANAHANLQASFAIIGYKGRNWRLKYRGEETLLQASAGTDHQGRPLPMTPVPELAVIIVGVSPGISKNYYMKGYAEGDNAAPDCFSANGIAPDPSAPHPQHPTCSLCPQNRFGSRVTENGKKAKACADSRRLAVVPDGDARNEAFGGPMMLRIPAMSLGNLDRYGHELERFGADMSQVRTTLRFNLDVAYPEIMFSSAGWVEDPDDYAVAQALTACDQVERMLGAPIPPEVTADIEGEAAVQPAASPLAAAPPAHVAPVQPAAQPAPAAPVAPAKPSSPFAAAAKATNGAATNGHTEPAPAQAPAQQPVAGAPRGRGRPPKQAPAQVAAPVETQSEPVQPTPQTVTHGVPEDMASVIDGLLE